MLSTAEAISGALPRAASSRRASAPGRSRRELARALVGAVAKDGEADVKTVREYLETVAKASRWPVEGVRQGGKAALRRRERRRLVPALPVRHHSPRAIVCAAAFLEQCSRQGAIEARATPARSSTCWSTRRRRRRWPSSPTAPTACPPPPSGPSPPTRRSTWRCAGRASTAMRHASSTSPRRRCWRAPRATPRPSPKSRRGPAAFSVERHRRIRPTSAAFDELWEARFEAPAHCTAASRGLWRAGGDGCAHDGSTRGDEEPRRGSARGHRARAREGTPATRSRRLRRRRTGGHRRRATSTRPRPRCTATRCDHLTVIPYTFRASPSSWGTAPATARRSTTSAPSTPAATTSAPPWRCWWTSPTTCACAASRCRWPTPSRPTGWRACSPTCAARAARASTRCARRPSPPCAAASRPTSTASSGRRWWARAWAGWPRASARTPCRRSSGPRSPLQAPGDRRDGGRLPQLSDGTQLEAAPSCTAPRPRRAVRGPGRALKAKGDPEPGGFCGAGAVRESWQVQWTPSTEVALWSDRARRVLPGGGRASARGAPLRAQDGRRRRRCWSTPAGGAGGAPRRPGAWPPATRWPRTTTTCRRWRGPAARSAAWRRTGPVASRSAPTTACWCPCCRRRSRAPPCACPTRRGAATTTRRR